MSRLDDLFKKMTLKKAAAVLAAALVFALLVSVVLNRFGIGDFFHQYISKYSIGADVLNTINGRDEKELAAVFSAGLQAEGVSIDEDIHRFYEVLDGKITKYELKGKRSRALINWDDGTVDFEEYRINFNKIETGSGGSYKIEFNFRTGDLYKGIFLMKLYKYNSEGGYSDIVTIGKNSFNGNNDEYYDYNFNDHMIF